MAGCRRPPPPRRAPWRGALVACVLVMLAGAAPGHAHGRAAPTPRAPLAPPTPLRTVPVGQNPLAIAVDERSRRVFVVNMGPANSLGAFVGRGSVSTLDAATGRLIRTVAVGRGGHAVAVDAPDNRAFVLNTDDGTLSLLDATSGALLRTIALVTGPDAAVGGGSVAVDPRTHHAVVVTESDLTDFYLLDARTGQLLHTDSLSNYNGSPRGVAVAVRARHAFVLHYSSAVDMLDTATGAVLRTLTGHGQYPPEYCAAAVDERANRVILAGGSVNEQIGRVDILDATTGAFLHSPPFADGCVLAVDAATGHAFVMFPLQAGSFESEHGRTNSTLDVFDVRSGQSLRYVANLGGIPYGVLGGGGYVAIDAPRHHAFVGLFSGGALRVYDTRTGADAGVYAGLGGPLAVDSQTGRLFVADIANGQGNGTVRVLDATRL